IHRTPLKSAVHKLPRASNGTNTADRRNSPSKRANPRRATTNSSTGSAATGIAGVTGGIVDGSNDVVGPDESANSESREAR
ncbi:hypothetical protein ACF08N_36825, partial [Streptomyces sp. NPDC015127]|uniref:hypothetical protein n=1 Tax=Streptomyces sp. NPDC015127 TaxID=3364939 RepID=UPI0037022C52